MWRLFELAVALCFTPTANAQPGNRPPTSCLWSHVCVLWKSLSQTRDVTLWLMLGRDGGKPAAEAFCLLLIYSWHLLTALIITRKIAKEHWIKPSERVWIHADDFEPLWRCLSYIRWKLTLRTFVHVADAFIWFLCYLLLPSWLWSCLFLNLLTTLNKGKWILSNLCSI